MKTKNVRVVLYFNAERKMPVMSLLSCLFNDFGFKYSDFEELLYSDSKAYSSRFSIDLEKAKDMLDVMRTLKISCIITDE